MAKKGKLYLIPAPLGEESVHTIPAYVIEHLHRLEVFIAERAKTARHFIKKTNPVKPFSELHFFELNKRTSADERNTFLEPAEEGRDIGLLSEAGCPGVADPGAVMVEMAHRRGIDVVPLVGPSSILLVLMASGMTGQQFCFHGYLSPKRPQLTKDLKRLEQQSVRFKQTQIFIETPYRNQQVLEQAMAVLNNKTRFCAAADLTNPEQWIRSASVFDWKKDPLPDLHKRPAIFCLMGA